MSSEALQPMQEAAAGRAAVDRAPPPQAVHANCLQGPGESAHSEPLGHIVLSAAISPHYPMARQSRAQAGRQRRPGWREDDGPQTPPP